ncbi:methyltransferase domain-containing protein [Rheinheimera sp. D18]|uniref:methyltransferase domain-containing protein n=1 Tax=Rheinheimera sp. D18 TaxID=2545632 RepID=UPI001A9F94E9|nr:methyltransferase domain-containing protein [Rheinheimera sp. D18]
MTVAMQPISERFISQVANSFSKASEQYITAARLQQQVALDALTLLPADRRGQLLDIGCGPGWIHPRFSAYSTGFSAVDLSQGMLQKAAQQQLATRYIQANAASLPLQNQSIDKVFSSLMLQWCPDPSAVLAEISRVLVPGGRAVITTLIDGTLTELKQAFASIDNQQHVNSFLVQQQLCAAAAQVPNVSWQFTQHSYQLYYPDVISLAKELKTLGANQVAKRHAGGLTGKNYWQRLATAYNQNCTALGLPATYQVLIISGVKHGYE